MKKLIEMGPYDFFITAFSETHVASHQFWHLRDPGHPSHDKEAAGLCSDALEKIYEAVDREIGKTINTLPSETSIVVMTQQGVENNYSGSHLVPEWLARRTGHGKGSVHGWRARTASLIPSSTRHRLAHLLPSSWADRWVSGKYRPEGDVFMLPGSEFMAFLRINLEGREPRGSLPHHQYQTTLKQLREEILELRNPVTGKPAAAEVLLPHKLFPGECADTLPDLIIRWKNDAPIKTLDCPTHGRISRGLSFIQNTPSCHTGEGLAVIRGPGIGHGTIRQAHPLQNLTTTLYTLLGLAPPQDLEGEQIPL
jgi:predicted AlkP superfamily phosphohydrolase/phosphomutase